MVQQKYFDRTIRDRTEGVVEHLFAEDSIAKHCRNTHFLKKECDVSMLLEPEFTRSLNVC